MASIGFALRGINNIPASKRVRSKTPSLILKDIPASRKWDLLILKDIPGSRPNFFVFRAFLNQVVNWHLPLPAHFAWTRARIYPIRN